MANLYNNLGIGGFLDLLFGQTGSLTKTYVLPTNGASFVVETNLEKYDGLGLTADPFDNWDSYSLVSQNGTGAVSSTGSTSGGGTQTWGLQYGSLQIINEEVPPLVGGLFENDRLRFELNTGPGSAWANLAPGGTLVQSITIRANEAGGFLILPDLDGDIGSYSDTFTFQLTFQKDLPPPNQVVDGTNSAQNMDIGFVDAQGDIIDGADGDRDIIYGNGGNDTINAGFGNDTVYAGTGDDNFSGGAGDDLLYGGDGNDFMPAGDIGNDTIYGGAGNDILSGDAGTDKIFGDAGDDVIEGHLGADEIFGG
ncbi:MAG: calcium-binding protein, partial [Cypionkella sp.]